MKCTAVRVISATDLSWHGPLGLHFPLVYRVRSVVLSLVHLCSSLVRDETKSSRPKTKSDPSISLAVLQTNHCSSLLQNGSTTIKQCLVLSTGLNYRNVHHICCKSLTISPIQTATLSHYPTPLALDSQPFI